jgi:pimeloyl-ACP methyl ester carboxylesterase
VELRYVDEGSGRPVVLIPGWMASVEFFRHQLQHLARRRRVLAYDPRSQGQSERPGAGNTFTQRGRDLDAFLTTLDLRDVVLVGWSYGSYDAYAYLRDFGTDRVAGLVVVDQPPRSWAPAEDTVSWSASPLRTDGLLTWQRAALDDRERWWTAMLSTMLRRTPAEPADAADLSWMAQVGMTMPAEAAALIVMDATTSDFTATAERVGRELPTLVYASSSALAAARDWLREHVPTAEIAETPTHLGFYLDPDGFNARLEAFLTRLPAGLGR